MFVAISCGSQTQHIASRQSLHHTITVHIHYCLFFLFPVCVCVCVRVRGVCVCVCVCACVWCASVCLWCGVCVCVCMCVLSSISMCRQCALTARVSWQSSQDTTGLSASWCSMSVKCLPLVSWLSKHSGNGWRWRSAHVFDLYRKQIGIYKQEAAYERQGLSPCMVTPPPPPHLWSA